jgi:hypothetical protein
MTETQIQLAYCALIFAILFAISFIAWIIYLKNELVKERNQRVSDGDIILKRANEIADKFELFHIDYNKEQNATYDRVDSIDLDLSMLKRIIKPEIRDVTYFSENGLLFYIRELLKAKEGLSAEGQGIQINAIEGLKTILNEHTKRLDLDNKQIELLLEQKHEKGIDKKPTTIKKKDHFIINTTPKKKVTTKPKKK